VIDLDVTETPGYVEFKSELYEEFDKVNLFFEDQLQQLFNQFYSLVAACVQLDLIPSYRPEDSKKKVD